MSSEHCGYIVKINELKKHPNADRLQIAVIFGFSTIVSLDVKIGDIGIYFPIDLQLSKEYCQNNDLVRRKDENGNPAGGYLDPNKRNIRAMRFRGTPSEGLFLPLDTLAYTGKTQFEVGEKIDNINGHEICCKYIPRNSIHEPTRKLGSKVRKKKIPIAPLFLEHADTEQLAYNLDAFRAGDIIEITLKMHGTSGRTGYLPKLQGYKRTFLDRILRKEGTPIYDWGYVSGTRRVVLSNFENGFYGDNSFREPHAKFFEGRLNKGETIYYEIVGFTTTGAPIMPSVANSKISDKEFSKRYGKITTFSYGCDPNGNSNKEVIWNDDVLEDIKYGDMTLEEAQEIDAITKPQSDCYVYRMTMTNEDGDIVEYSPDYMRYRCEQIGVKCVPVLWRGIIPEKHFIDKGIVKEEPFGEPIAYVVSQEEVVNPGEYIKKIAEQYYDGPDPIGKTHVREGVVIRIVNRPKFSAYKHKNFSFKVLEGIAKDIAAAPDIEEAQEIMEEE